MEKSLTHVEHAFGPVCDPGCRILILGTMPSPKSREEGFYYSHPRNRFWDVLSVLFDESKPKTPAEKREFVLRHHIALWDVLYECDISGASDSSIRNPVPNDIGSLLRDADIKAIYTTGNTAEKYYSLYCEKDTGMPCVKLPSTSPANAAWSLGRLCSEYRKILETL